MSCDGDPPPSACRAGAWGSPWTEVHRRLRCSRRGVLARLEQSGFVHQLAQLVDSDSPEPRDTLDLVVTAARELAESENSPLLERSIDLPSNPWAAGEYRRCTDDAVRLGKLPKMLGDGTMAGLSCCYAALVLDCDSLPSSAFLSLPIDLHLLRPVGRRIGVRHPPQIAVPVRRVIKVSRRHAGTIRKHLIWQGAFEPVAFKQPRWEASRCPEACQMRSVRSSGYWPPRARNASHVAFPRAVMISLPSAPDDCSSRPRRISGWIVRSAIVS